MIVLTTTATLLSSLRFNSLLLLLLLDHLLLKLLLLLLLFGDLVLSDTLHELMRVGHDLRDQVMLVVILQIVDLLQIFVVLLGHVLDVSDQVFIL